MLSVEDATAWGRLLGLCVGSGVVIGLVMRAFRSGWFGE